MCGRLDADQHVEQARRRHLAVQAIGLQVGRGLERLDHHGARAHRVADRHHQEDRQRRDDQGGDQLRAELDPRRGPPQPAFGGLFAQAGKPQGTIALQVVGLDLEQPRLVVEEGRRLAGDARILPRGDGGDGGGEGFRTGDSLGARDVRALVLLLAEDLAEQVVRHDVPLGSSGVMTRAP